MRRRTPQVLINPAYHDQVVANAVKYGGPGAQGTLDQILTALQHSLAVGIGQGMAVVLGFSLMMLAATLFLKNVPLRSGWGAATEPAGGSAGATPGASGGSEWGQAPAGATPGASSTASLGSGLWQRPVRWRELESGVGGRLRHFAARRRRSGGPWFGGLDLARFGRAPLVKDEAAAGSSVARPRRSLGRESIDD